MERRSLQETAHRVQDRVGRRGWSLLFLALLDAAMTIWLASMPAWTRAAQPYRSIDDLAPIPVWAGLWAAVGAVCLVGAFLRQDRVAFTAAAALKFTWSTAYVFAWLVQDAARGWVSAAVWAAFGLWVLLISTWPETVRVPDAPRPPGAGRDGAGRGGGR